MKINKLLVFTFLLIFMNLVYVNALPTTIGPIKQVGNTLMDACGQDSDGDGEYDCYGVPLKVYVSNGENIPVICTDYDKRSPAAEQVSCTLTDDWALNIRYGVAAIIRSASEISGSAVNAQYFSAEMAINRFLYEKLGGEAGRQISVNTLTNVEPYYFRRLYNNYLSEANNAYESYDTDKTVSITLSTSSLVFTLNGSNYESNSITVSGVNNSHITTNIGSVSKSGSTFKVIVPSASVSDETTVKVTINATKTLEFARNYYCTSDTYQTLTPITLDTQTYSDSKEITGTITPEKTKGKLIINKLDEDKKHLSGAILVVTGPNNFSKTYQTEGNAITISDLEYGTYTITETIAPSGYVIAEKQTVTINESNQVANITMIDKITKIKISKTDITGKNELPGATLEIQDASGNVVNYCEGKECKWVSTNTPYEIIGLPVGTYYLVETIAPSGYALNKEKVKFQVTEQDTEKTIKMENQSIKVIIKKINSEDKRALPGASLEVHDKDGNIVKYCKDGKGNNNVECKWISTEEPYEIEGMPVGTYYLVEIAAPEGYELNTKKIEFEVKNDTKDIQVEMVNQLEVDVPDTLRGRSTLLIAIAMFDIALGIGIITFVRKNKVKDN